MTTQVFIFFFQMVTWMAMITRFISDQGES